MYVNICIYIYVCIYIYICMYIYVCIYIYLLKIAPENRVPKLHRLQAVHVGCRAHVAQLSVRSKAPGPSNV